MISELQQLLIERILLCWISLLMNKASLSISSSTLMNYQKELKASDCILHQTEVSHHQVLRIQLTSLQVEEMLM